jgi:CubicO group peptidase (beta-lactamase class C family)
VIEGRTAAGYEPVAEAFAVEIERDRDAGAAFAAVVAGEAVVDLWGGVARRDPPAPWREDTIQLIFSGTKGLTATCILLLLDRGKLSLDAPVAAYWPEFAQSGKEHLLVRHLLSHQAGLPAVEPPPSVEEALDPRLMAARLAQQAPLWPSGSGITYHALTFGWLCDGLIRSVDGRSAGRFFADEIAAPLRLDAWIGLPDSLYGRIAIMQRSSEYQVNFGDVSPDERALLTRIYSGGGIVGDRFIVNDPLFLRAEMPGVNGVATARSMARLYGCLANGGEVDGIRIMSPDVIRFAYAPIGAGLDRLTHKPAAFSTGFEIQSELQWFGPTVQAFGHSGAGGSVHGAWPHLRTGFSYAMNLMRRDDRDGRAQRILGALHKVVSRRPENVPVRAL